jgi:hypothetical protein
MNLLLRLNLFLLLAVAIFDPSDLLVQLKVPLFFGVWLLFLVDIVISTRNRYPVPASLYFYILVFVLLLPLIGLLVYVLRGGGTQDYDGFRFYKSYLFLTLCIPLALKRLDLIRPLAYMLSVLAIATIYLYTLTVNDDLLGKQLAAFGDAYVLFSMTERTYGSLSYQNVYFHASPLFVTAIVFFCYQFVHSIRWAKLWYGFFLVLNICGMILSGTRNNMLVAIFAPLLVLAWYRGTKVRLTIAALLIVIVVAGFSSGVIQAMFSGEDYGNAVKLGHVHDYGVLFSDWRTLLFGQGFGAGFFSTAWGTTVTLTELTYLEIIRNYGIILAPVFYLLILFPLRVLADQRAQPDHYLFLGYACYLYLCAGNPLLLSSTGMLVLAIVLTKTFRAYPGVDWNVPKANLQLPGTVGYTRAVG